MWTLSGETVFPRGTMSIGVWILYVDMGGEGVMAWKRGLGVKLGRSVLGYDTVEKCGK